MALTQSRKPRKQRKARAEAPLHARRQFVSVHLSKEVKEKLKIKKRSLPVRKGDKVKVMAGEFKGHTGKVVRVDLRDCKVYVEGVVRRRGKGGESQVPIHPSKLMIVEVDLSDKKRSAALNKHGVGGVG
ncbi:MAG: 50S ribosomal protein L24 [Candidatus Micrarchaeia archaeon]